MEQFEDSTARELELTDGDFHLRLSRIRRQGQPGAS